MLQTFLIVSGILVAIWVIRTLIYGPSEPRQTVLAVVVSAAIFVTSWMVAAEMMDDGGSIMWMRAAGPVGVLLSVFVCRIIFWNHHREVVLGGFILVTLAVLYFGRGTAGIIGFCLPTLLVAGYLFKRTRES